MIRLRESVGKLEARLERARAAGDDKLASETEASLTTQREWLAQAEVGGGLTQPSIAAAAVRRVDPEHVVHVAVDEYDGNELAPLRAESSHRRS